MRISDWSSDGCSSDLNMFRPEDNLESWYARDALIQLYRLIARGKVECCSLGSFEDMTGLKLADDDGGLSDDVPGIGHFLNRMLALTIAMLEILIDIFEGLLNAGIEAATYSRSYLVGHVNM